MTTEQALALKLPTHIVGSRIALLAYQDGDAQTMFDLTQRNRDMLEHWMYWAAGMRTLESFHDWVASTQQDWRERKEFCFGIVPIEQFSQGKRAIVGGVSLFNANWAVPSFEVGYFLDRAQHGNGLVSEAIQLLVNYGFTELHAKRVWASCDANNQASEAVMKRVGMQLEGRLRNDRLTPKGELRDTLVYSVLVGEN
jgi:RimJ/RimL family protein N-acetyltransferase